MHNDVSFFVRSARELRRVARGSLTFRASFARRRITARPPAAEPVRRTARCTTFIRESSAIGRNAAAESRL
jgi:hypothetical protein